MYNHQYTRQRQGRDFKDNSEDKQSLLHNLEQYKTEAEQTGKAVPVDGEEPIPETVEIKGR